jgi:hypothetical protein
LENSDYSQSKKFSLCFDCGKNEHKKLQCNLCQMKTTVEQNHMKETLKCISCKKYSHIACSRVNLKVLEALLEEVNSKIEDPKKKLASVEQVYRCFECLVSEKSVNFLILESCLHYEAIHHLVQRQKFLAEICTELLSNYFPKNYREKVPLFLDKFMI